MRMRKLQRIIFPTFPTQDNSVCPVCGKEIVGEATMWPLSGDEKIYCSNECLQKAQEQSGLLYQMDKQTMEQMGGDVFCSICGSIVDAGDNYYISSSGSLIHDGCGITHQRGVHESYKGEVRRGPPTNEEGLS